MHGGIKLLRRRDPTNLLMFSYGSLVSIMGWFISGLFKVKHRRIDFCLMLAALRIVSVDEVFPGLKECQGVKCDTNFKFGILDLGRWDERGVETALIFGVL